MGRPKGSKNKKKEEIVFSNNANQVSIDNNREVTVTIKALDHGFLVKNGVEKAYSTWDEVTSEIALALEG